MRCLISTLFFLSLIIPSLALAGKVHEYQLKNGLKLIVKEDHRAPVVISEVWYKVGSSYEPDGITGISHALEHMMFQGTKKFPAGELSRIIAANGGQENAATNYDFTFYYQLFSADKLPLSFRLEADRMQNLQLKEKNFVKEIQVVMEEWRMRLKDNPQSLTYERFAAAANVSNPYHHTPIGWIDDLRNMKVGDLRKWYDEWYAPNNAVVVVVGDVDPQAVYGLAKKYFGSLDKKNLPVLKPRNELRPVGERNVVVRAPAKLPWLVMGYNTPVVNTAKEKWEPYALDVAAAILDGGASARLTTDLIRGKQIAANADADYDPFMRVDDLFILSGTPAQGQSVKRLKKAFLNEIQRLRTKAVSPGELERVKAQVIADRVFSRDSLESQANEIGSLESVGLSWKVGEEFVKNIKAVTPEQVLAVAKKYFVPERLTVGVLDPLPLTHDLKTAPTSIGDQHVR